jgi:YD repeat-containing protein
MNRLFSQCTAFAVLCCILLIVLFLFPFCVHSVTISYQYDRLNRLTSVTYGDGTRIAYLYDPAGNRLSRALSKVVIPVVGNINGDDSVNLADAILALKVLSGLDATGIRSGYAASGADIGGNGKVGPEEVIYILQRVAGMRQE